MLIKVAIMAAGKQDFKEALQLFKAAFIFVVENCDVDDKIVRIFAAEVLLKHVECFIELVSCS